MREAMEDVLYANGVDVILNGHLHVYERTFPMYVSSSVVSCMCEWSCKLPVVHSHWHELTRPVFAGLQKVAWTCVSHQQHACKLLHGHLHV